MQWQYLICSLALRFLNGVSTDITHETSLATHTREHIFAFCSRRKNVGSTNKFDGEPFPTSLLSRYSLFAPHLSTVIRALNRVCLYEEADGCYSYDHFCTTSRKEI